MSNAFDFASTAVKLYQQRDPIVLSAAELLFDVATIPLAMAKLAGVASMSEYKGVATNFRAQGITSLEVVYSCSFATLSPNTKTLEDGSVWAFEQNGQYAEPVDEIFTSCRDGTVINGVINAYTNTFRSPLKPQITRLCPQFLSYIAAQRFWSSEQLDPSWLVNIPPEVTTVLNTMRGTPVDLYGLFELILLHELTHTISGGSSKDLQGMGSGGFTFVRSVGPLAWDDAETLAFMGLLGKLAQLGFEVDPYGNLIQSAAEIPGVRRKRSRVNGSHLDRDD